MYYHVVWHNDSIAVKMTFQFFLYNEHYDRKCAWLHNSCRKKAKDKRKIGQIPHKKLYV